MTDKNQLSILVLGFCALFTAGCSAAPGPTPIATQPVPSSVAPAAVPSSASSRTPLPSVTPAGAQKTGVLVATSPAPTRAASPAASSTSALLALSTTNPDTIATQRAASLPTAAAVQSGVAPPLTIQLPGGWKSTYTAMPVSVSLAQSSDSQEGVNASVGTAQINVAAYAGPVSDGGTGFIFVLWDFPSVVPIDPRAMPTSALDAQRQASLSDGYRLLRGAILDESCLVNIYGQNNFPVGGQQGIGDYFQTTGCQDNRPDIVGWYSGLWQGGHPFLFYSYVEPPTAFNNGRADLQKILDSVQFNVGPVGTVSSPPTAAPSQATSAPLPGTPPAAATTTPELN